MVYNSKLVVCVKVDGKVLRELGDIVYLPFGSEYSLLIKNLNSVRVQVGVNIDGQPVLEEHKLVINPGKEVVVERFIKNGNLSCGNRLKFIERTQSIEDHRGIGIEDGLVQVEYEFEQEKVPVVQFNPFYISPSYYTPIWYSPAGLYRPGDVVYGQSSTIGETEIKCSSAGILRGAPTAGCSANVINDAGITVPGSVSEQRFDTVRGILGDGCMRTIILRLKGASNCQTIKKAITVKHSAVCQTCGRKNKLSAKFCSNCGSALELIS